MLKADSSVPASLAPVKPQESGESLQAAFVQIIANSTESLAAELESVARQIRDGCAGGDGSLNVPFLKFEVKTVTAEDAV